MCDIEGAVVRGNRDIDCRATVSPVSTRAVRLLVTKTTMDISRIHEIEIYALAGKYPGPTTGWAGFMRM